MKRTFVFVIVASFFVTLYAQSPAKYWVQFKDKANTTYSIDRPQEFLSLRAIEKRQRFNIDITEQDFPVNESYIRQVLALDENMVLLTKSKWLNGITVYSTVKDIDKQIRELKCVAMCECTASLENEETFDYPQSTYTPPKTTKEVFVADEHVGNFSYGKTSVQLAMNQAHWLHRLGARGEGMLMVVMDGGFKNANKMECFEALRQEGRLLGTRNFVQPGRSVFISGSHGSEVLSCITGYVDNEFMGTAPKASFYLAMTEDSRSENKIEEDNWVAGVEWADSLGCDVLNSSLGYYKFDNKLQSYQYEEMNGKISRASQAATLAAQKGMIICVSAGNEGDEEWHYITAPADAEGVLTVGAIDREGSMAEFSSTVPPPTGASSPTPSPSVPASWSSPPKTRLRHPTAPLSPHPYSPAWSPASGNSSPRKVLRMSSMPCSVPATSTAIRSRRPATVSPTSCLPTTTSPATTTLPCSSSSTTAPTNPSSTAPICATEASPPSNSRCESMEIPTSM